MRAFGTIIRNGHLYKGVKPVYWCLDCRSALAEAEVEYEEHDLAGDRRRASASSTTPIWRAHRPARGELDAAGRRRDLDDDALDAAGEPGGRARRDFVYVLVERRGGGAQRLVLAAELLEACLQRYGMTRRAALARVRRARARRTETAASVPGPAGAGDPRRARDARCGHRRGAHRARARPRTSLSASVTACRSRTRSATTAASCPARRWSRD